jgi:hypothetical protein
MCFLCDEWILGVDGWEKHCRAHLYAPESFPVQCDPLTSCDILVAPGYCPICIGNETLSGTQRMYQYLNRNSWMDHVSRCFDAKIADHTSSTGTDNALKCDHLHPRCAVPLESVQKLRFHYEDVHCVSFAKGTKRPLSHTEIETGSEVEPKAGRPDTLRNMTPDKAKRKGTILQTAQCTFAHKTVESFMAPPACLATTSQAVESVPATHHPSRGLPAASPASLGHSLSMPHWRSDGSASAAETPASSANSDDWLQFIDLQLVGKPDAPIDREAELGADRPSKLRKPTPDKG